jgi:16S rRNA (guanine966-N2)-methyltransferase
MRIGGGAHKGRALIAPSGRETRPTSDRIRETIFNILVHSIDNFDLSKISVVDVFAGTGALGFEALSRGAKHATFIDSSRRALDIVKKNSTAFNEWRNTTLLKLDATNFSPPPRAAKAPCGLAFLDAPYEKELSLPALLGIVNKGWVKSGAIVIVEMAAKELIDLPRQYEILGERTYGSARILTLKVR